MALTTAYPRFKIRRGPGLSPAYGSSGGLSLAYGVGFNIYDLFAGDAGGFLYHHQDWYDKLAANDPVLFKDNTGSDECTAIGDIIGMRLDRRLGLVRGSELIATTNLNGFSDTPNVTHTDTSFTLSSGTGGVTRNLLTVGTWYEIVASGSSSSNVSINTADALTPTTRTEIRTGIGRCIFRADMPVLYIRAATSGTYDVDSISLKTLSGNHATQSTSASRARLARHPRRGIVNLLTKTEAFDNSAWTKGNSSVTANATIAPDGTITADKLVENSSAGTHTALQSVASVSGSTYTLSVYLKASERDDAVVTINVDGTEKGGYFDLTAGTITASPSGGATTDRTITDAGDGWWKITLTQTASATTATAKIYTADGTTASYTGDGSSGIYLWGAQLEEGSTATTYQRVDDAWDVIEDSRTRRNLLTYTEEFDNAVWVKTASSVSENARQAPDGTVTADKLVEDNSTGQHFLGYVATLQGSTQYTMSFYVEAGERDRVAISGSGGTWGSFSWTKIDLATGTEIASSGFTFVSATDVGGGIYRIVVSATTTASPSSGQVFQISTLNAAGDFSYAGDGSSGLYLWGAQLEIAASASDYQPVTTWYSAQEVDAANGRHIYYIRYDGVDDKFDIVGSASNIKLHDGTGWEVAAAAAFGFSANPDAVYALFGSNAGAGANIGAAALYDDRASVPRSDAIVVQVTTGSVDAINSSTNDLITPQQATVLRWRYKNDTPDFLLHINGVQEVSVTTANTPSTSNSTYDLQIGAAGNGAVPAALRDYGMVAVEGDLTSTKALQLDYWLARQYGGDLDG